MLVTTTMYLDQVSISGYPRIMKNDIDNKTSYGYFPKILHCHHLPAMNRV